MPSGLRFAPALFALLFGFTMEPANALTSRSGNFAFSCKGLQDNVVIKFSGFPANSSQTVLGGEIALFENKTEGDSGRSATQYIVLFAESSPTKEILALGILQNYAKTLFPLEGYQVTTNGAGETFVTIAGACNQGFSQQVQGIVTIYFKTTP